MGSPVLLLSSADVEQLLEPLPLIEAVEEAFRARGSGATQPGGVLGVELTSGGFHIKAAALGADVGVFVTKLNGNFPQNPATNLLPTVQGLVLVADVSTGAPLAILDSGALTRLRTAAASAVAIKHLARLDGSSATLIGCGVQAFDQLRFAHAVRPLKRIALFDPRPATITALVARLRDELGVAAHAGRELSDECAASAIIITCTTSRTPFLHDADVPPGALVVAVGADNPLKHEIDPLLLSRALVVTDDTAQCALIGDLHHALKAGVMTSQDVHAELGEIVAGVRPGRRAPDDRMIFDSTGTPIQDAAAAAVALERARARGVGTPFSFRS